MCVCVCVCVRVYVCICVCVSDVCVCVFRVLEDLILLSLSFSLFRSLFIFSLHSAGRMAMCEGLCFVCVCVGLLEKDCVCVLE